ncbi:IS1 family transposase [Phreatobacter stygius]|uniref:IS1 family transposase n=1 Tax=Phreatobacter stygius TaxID=1940610 RepID=A0A4D7AZ82_9HYPH|nr:IS1 family transposase [Phreatobacter stygius]QCI64093.1 IS1 family transposase [Phreatobacter stygius]
MSINLEDMQDEDAACRFLEYCLDLDNLNCPHCGEIKRIGRLEGRSTRKSTFKCYSCRKSFSLRAGTIFEGSHIPLHIWLQALFLTVASRGRLGAHNLERLLHVSLMSAWSLKRKIIHAVGWDLICPERDAGDATAGPPIRWPAIPASLDGQRKQTVAQQRMENLRLASEIFDHPQLAERFEEAVIRLLLFNPKSATVSSAAGSSAAASDAAGSEPGLFRGLEAQGQFDLFMRADK